MDAEISFSLSQLVSIIIGVCAAIATISTAVSIIAKAIEKAKAPEAKQDERLDKMEKRLDDMDSIILKFKGYFSNDDNRFKAIEKSNKITQTALLALLKHSLNGNDIEALKDAEKSLEDYLIEK